MKNLTKLAVLATAAFAAVAAQAQSIYFLTIRGNEVYQVIPGSNTGGAFVRKPTLCPAGMVNGYTDRLQRGETYGAFFTSPNGVLTTNNEVGFTVNGVLRYRRTGMFLPWFSGYAASCDSNDDNIVWYVRSPFGSNTLRLPIGRR